MFDLSFAEMLLAGAVALIVLGPERLPKVARFVGEWVGKIQRMAAGVKNELTAQADYADLAKIKQDVQDTADALRGDLRDLEQQWQSSVPPWERLPEQRTPADFGVDETAWSGSLNEYLPPVAAWQVKSLRKQALSRKRDLRPRYRPKPKLRMRK